MENDNQGEVMFLPHHQHPSLGLRGKPVIMYLLRYFPFIFLSLMKIYTLKFSFALLRSWVQMIMMMVILLIILLSGLFSANYSSIYRCAAHLYFRHKTLVIFT